MTTRARTSPTAQTAPTPLDRSGGSNGSGGSGGSDAAVLADAVAAAARSVPGVADLHTGAFGEVATYLPRRRVNGVRLRDDVTEIHVVLTWGAPLLDTADRVRAAVAALVTTPVDVTVEDVVGPSPAASGAPGPPDS